MTLVYKRAVNNNVTRSLQNEFDYKVEAANLEEVRHNMGDKFVREAVVPRAYPELSEC